MSTVIEASPRRVWRALTLPSERAAWDDRIIAPIDVDSSYPFAGQHVRWRSRLGGVPVVMHDRPSEIVPYERLQTVVQMGSLRTEQTWSLAAQGRDDAGEPASTLLGLKIVASNSVPVVGAEVDRFAVRRMTVDQVDTALKAVQHWCQEHP